jgi:ribonuclease P protein component
MTVVGWKKAFRLTPAVIDRRYSGGSRVAAPSESLPRSRIIRRRGVFDVTRNKGRRVSNQWMALNYIAREAVQSGETGSVAFLTPKRVGAATKRTQLRRRMREIFRRHLARPEETAYLVWIAHPSAVELPFEELLKCMTALRERIKV